MSEYETAISRRVGGDADLCAASKKELILVQGSQQNRKIVTAIICANDIQLIATVCESAGGISRKIRKRIDARDKFNQRGFRAVIAKLVCADLLDDDIPIKANENFFGGCQ